MRTQLTMYALTLFVSLATSVAANAAVITFVGRDAGTFGNHEDDSVDGFRSTSVAKPFDGDGDDIYGTDGYVLYGVDNVPHSNGGTVDSGNPLTYDPSGSKRTILSLPSYLTLSNNGQDRIASSYGYRQLDNPELAPGPAVANIESGGALNDVTKGTESSMVNINIGAGAPADGFRVGILSGNTDRYDGTIRLTQTSGAGAGTATTAQIEGESADFYFFDVVGAAPGDVLTLYLTKGAAEAGNNNVIYGGLVFDSIVTGPAVPEPSTAALVGLALLGMTALRRRR